MEEVWILDFGSQYTQLIARRIREQGVFSRIVPHTVTMEEVRKHNVRALVFSGGPASVLDEKSPRCDPALLRAGIPVLGICYGMQLIVLLEGGEVVSSVRREYGRARLYLSRRDDPLFEGVEDGVQVWMSHGDSIGDLPEGYVVLARTDDVPAAAVRSANGMIYGLQFHPEVAHTECGERVMSNFLFRVAGCKGDWSVSSFIDDAVEQIRRQVGDGRVLCALSGGVDSSVLAMLLKRAVGDRVVCVFINNGLLRKGEVEEVRGRFEKTYGMNLVYVDASDRFLDALKGVTDPERKRKVIGEMFIRVFEETVSGLGNDIRFLAQGTLYPDVIESLSPINGPSATIKSHHNVGGLPEDMEFELVEPLRLLFKDEVRRVGEQLGLPREVVWRHPFPGPGLAVRVVGAVTRRRLEIVRQADAIFLEELRREGLYDEVWQAFAALLPVRSVGVMGDERTYDYIVALRAVTSRDGMTADWARLPHEFLAKVSSRIVNEVSGVNRVVYDVSSKPPGTVEFE